MDRLPFHLAFAVMMTALLVAAPAQAGCNKIDSRLANCDTPLGTQAFTHVEIEREDCVTTATIFQPSSTGEPSPILAVAVTGLPENTSDGLPNEFKGTGFDLNRTDGTGTPPTGEFMVHLNAKTQSGKQISEDLKCYL